MKVSRYEIRPDLCRRCGSCVRACPRGAIAERQGESYVIDQARCDRCGTCQSACKLRAIVKKAGLFR